MKRTLDGCRCRIPGHLIVGLCLILGQFAFSADVIPFNRRINWQGNVGVPGGIVSNRTVYTTISAGASQSTIQSALNNCPSNQIVQLSAGTYNISSQLQISRNGVTLRGAGPGQTIILSSGSPAILVGNGNWYNEWANPVASKHINWTDGYTQGTNVITVASTSGISVGTLIYMDQLNDPDTSEVGSSSHGTSAFPDLSYTSVTYPSHGQDRIQHQLNRVIGINGNNLTLSEPVYMPNYSATYVPQIWYWNGGIPVASSGVEDMTVTTAGGEGVDFQDAYGCWARNVNVSGPGDHNGYLFTMVSLRCEIRHCRLDGPNGANDNYGIFTVSSSGILVEDNIGAHFVGTPIMIVGASGCVYAYNYMTNVQNNTGLMSAGILAHGGFPTMNLCEGNVAPNFGMDNTWGGAAYNTGFRNRFTGIGDPPISASGNMEAVQISNTNRHMSFAGNVLGTRGVHNVYEDTGLTSCNDGHRVYFIGGNYGCDFSFGYDSGDYTTLLRVCNWDSATTTNGGIVNGGYLPSDLPSSYYLTSKPAYFGSLRWPPVDPTDPNYSMSYTNIPAGYRYVYGVDPPSGPANLPPVDMMVLSTNSVRLNSPYSVRTNTPVTFDASGSSDPEGVTLTFSWQFGDGGTATGSKPVHSYSTNGTFNVRLDVSDGVNTTTTNQTIRVTLVGVNLPPTASARASVTAGPAPLTVNFTGTNSSDPEGSSLTYSWNFGDGTTSTAANPSKVYSSPGTYTAQLTVSDGTNTSAPSSVTISVSTPSSGLVAAYSFDEGSGGTVGDASGNNNAGTIANATWFGSGRFGNALSFGSGALVTVPDSATLNFTSGMTLEAWVNPSSLSGSWMNVIFKSNGNPSTSNPAYVLQGCSPSSSVPSFYMNGASGNLTAPSALPLNNWSHIAVTYDGAALRFYVNGLFVASAPQTGAMTSSTDPVTIGGNSYSGQNWSGLIDEVRIYNRALSQSEIHTDMNVPVAGTSSRPSVPQNFHVAGQ